MYLSNALGTIYEKILSYLRITFFTIFPIAEARTIVNANTNDGVEMDLKKKNKKFFLRQFTQVARLMF